LLQFLEENDVPVKHRGNSVFFRVAPHEIRTFKVSFKPKTDA